VTKTFTMRTVVVQVLGAMQILACYKAPTTSSKCMRKGDKKLAMPETEVPPEAARAPGAL
jgi:hypothetical protein